MLDLSWHPLAISLSLASFRRALHSRQLSVPRATTTNLAHILETWPEDFASLIYPQTALLCAIRLVWSVVLVTLIMACNSSPCQDYFVMQICKMRFFFCSEKRACKRSTGLISCFFAVRVPTHLSSCVGSFWKRRGEWQSNLKLKINAIDCAWRIVCVVWFLTSSSFAFVD